jgi:hypothetical protein
MRRASSPSIEQTIRPERQTFGDQYTTGLVEPKDSTIFHQEEGDAGTRLRFESVRPDAPSPFR